MIPDFDDRGYLPPGIHAATFGEIASRFGRSPELRQVQLQSLNWLMDLARRAGIERVVVNGSFVTDITEPNDVDCVLLMGPDFPVDFTAARELRLGLPFITMELVGREFFDLYVRDIFASDRADVPKGMVEVIL